MQTGGGYSNFGRPPRPKPIDLAAVQMGATKPCEWNDRSSRTHAVFDNPPRPRRGLFRLTGEPGLGLSVNDAELEQRRVLSVE